MTEQELISMNKQIVRDLALTSKYLRACAWLNIGNIGIATAAIVISLLAMN